MLTLGVVPDTGTPLSKQSVSARGGACGEALTISGAPPNARAGPRLPLCLLLPCIPMGCSKSKPVPEPGFKGVVPRPATEHAMRVMYQGRRNLVTLQPDWTFHNFVEHVRESMFIESGVAVRAPLPPHPSFLAIACVWHCVSRAPARALMIPPRPRRLRVSVVSCCTCMRDRACARRMPVKHVCGWCALRGYLNHVHPLCERAPLASHTLHCVGCAWLLCALTMERLPHHRCW